MSVFSDLVGTAGNVRVDWTRRDIAEIFSLPMTKLVFLAQSVQQIHFGHDDVQFCSLLSVKTGGCKEDCSYCPQSAHYQTEVDAHGLLDSETIVQAAKAAKSQGASRFCMGAAWRSPPSRGTAFDQLLESIRSIRKLDMEVCTTLGMIDEDQAHQLKAAGVHAYNHNLDTSPEYYPEVITTRTYGDRLRTLQNVRKAGMTICCGGIVGMGESREDRIGLLKELATMDPHPESVPINLLVRVEGTPLASEAEHFDFFEMVRTIATARILMPRSRVRLSAGRSELSDEAQALCYLAGANSIFVGEKLLTTANPEIDEDTELLHRLGLRAQRPDASEKRYVKEDEGMTVFMPQDRRCPSPSVRESRV